MLAADDFDEIRKHVERVRAEEKPKCPRAADRLLYDCLRNSVQCSGECPYKDDWIGPNG